MLTTTVDIDVLLTAYTTRTSHLEKTAAIL